MAEDKKKEIAVIEITEEYMRDRLYEFRGKKVMLDSDLAEIYGYETKNFKRQVKNNIAKFEGDDFMFELNDEEVENLSRCKNFTLNMGRGSNIKYKPYVFTEHLKNSPTGVNITLFSDNVGNNKLHNIEFTDFCKEYPSVKISMKKTGGIFHDRFIVLDYGTADERVFLCGASSKDAGARITSIVEDYGVSKYTPVIATLLKNPILILPQ